MYIFERVSCIPLRYGFQGVSRVILVLKQLNSLVARCTFTRIDFTTVMKVWSGKFVAYSNLKFFKIRIVKCVLIVYPEGMNGYKIGS